LHKLLKGGAWKVSGMIVFGTSAVPKALDECSDLYLTKNTNKPDY